MFAKNSTEIMFVLRPLKKGIAQKIPNNPFFFSYSVVSTEST